MPRERTTLTVVVSVLATMVVWAGVGTVGLVGIALAAGSPAPTTAAPAPSPTLSPTPLSPSPTSSATPTNTPSLTSTSPTPTTSKTTTTTKAAPRTTSASKTSSAQLVPVVGVSDGDTLRVRVDGKTERVRIIGIDAPELREQECWAQKAASRIQSLAQSRSVRLERDPSQADRDRYGRLLRHVVLDDGRLAAEVMVSEGHVREYTYAAAYKHRDRYLAAQTRAKAAKRGVWSAACAAPAPVARPTTKAPSTPKQCTIKGNISRSGERIYHVPGQRNYDDTVIDVSKGERWFCTESEAQQAGWRKAKR